MGGTANDVPPAVPTRLDERTQFGSAPRPWLVRAYPDAGEVIATRLWQAEEASASRTGDGRAVPRLDDVGDARSGIDPRSIRRSRAALRRYAAANRLRILATLTYAGEGVHGFDRLRADVAYFERRFRAAYPRTAFALAFELHPGGHGWHVHMAVPSYVPKDRLARLWGHGFVDIREVRGRTGTRPGRDAARRVARYLAKYVAKDGAAIPPGRQRYAVRSGFQPRCEVVEVGEAAALEGAYAWLIGEGDPAYVWASMGDADWTGPPVIYAAW